MQKISLHNLFVVLLGAFILASCSKFDKLVKSSDYELKYSKALEYYKKENYTNAMTLFEELIPVFKGTQRAEEIYYYYAYCNYHLGDFGLAAYHFKMFVRNFPGSKHAEECAFMNAFCYFQNSPKYSLDQEDTKTAIAELQEFLNKYPESERIDECNSIMDKLRGKLEKKAYEITKQYYFIEDWKAAIVESKNFLNDFQNSYRCEEIHFINLRSNYLLTKNSIPKKREERLDNTIESYLKFINSYPQSKYLSDAENIYDGCQKIKEELAKEAKLKKEAEKNGL